MIYRPSTAEKKKLQQTIRIALSVPFIAGIEGYVWESVFHFIKGLPPPNPHSDKRKKLLFDAVDTKHKIGWSLKAVQKSPKVGMNFELVIQRADVLRKRVELGFSDLTLDSSTTQLGHAILAHWNRKIVGDMRTQGVAHPRIAILCKSKNHRHYAFLDHDLRQFSKDELSWSWTDDTRNGLQAHLSETGAITFRWYPNQKQLFQVFTLAPEAFHFEMDIHRFTPNELQERLILPP